MADVRVDANYVVGLIDERDAAVDALRDALALTCLPEHAWSGVDDERFARCQATLAKLTPRTV